MKNELVVCTRPKSNVSEDIRTIRTNLQFISSSKNSNAILVASSVQGEGKSFISSNLSAAFAQNGNRVILIDSDLRLGRLHKIFGISNEIGLSNLLVRNKISGLAEFIQATNVENLFVIPRGVVPPNPSELLDSENAKELIAILKEKFDYVIIDGVPINGLPDSLILANMVDRVVLVSSIGYSSVDEIEEAKKSLEKIGAKIAGVVANKAPQTKRGKYSNYYE